MSLGMNKCDEGPIKDDVGNGRDEVAPGR